ncbi:ABC transporter ATP-binding protein [Ureibacillus massiliensis 4400831 = CIP 108448 = CCUG 49529]|uniref:ABC transporter ATP-binding protein n=1 Tax=Ureibacillus massiliensis 4400831 = CIP 108448 = CCUG 49529 TaxID=1211035 RepID=A0A0A3J310_9BACL|nr:ABC transporter permease [Ureibacillus massiliensis]KGR91276.1 ABC transporter ATP-binding protein [Ureibacillus massiliensis 4400831 = CIP 108448 = CCUG 49529]RKJ55302.1 ABC transporter permease [Butyricicoccus sp. 1XD8-22]
MTVKTVSTESKKAVKKTSSVQWKSLFGLKYLGPIIAFVVFISVWQFVPMLMDIKPFILPKPTDVLEAAIEDWHLLWPAMQMTIFEAVIGFVLSAVIGIGISILLASSRVLEISLYPYAVILQTIPVVAIAPIVVIWFGSGFNSIVIISFLIGFFPIVSNTLMGLNSVDNNMGDLFKLYNANKWQTMFKLRIPAAMPFIMSGLKVSCTLAIIGAITGEYIAGIGGGKGGLGYAITVAAVQLKTPYLFACAIAGALFGIVFYLLVSLLSRLVLKSWHESAMKVEK